MLPALCNCGIRQVCTSCRLAAGLEAVQAQADSIFASEAGSGAASQALSYQQQMPIASAAPGRHPVPPGFPLPQHSHDHI